MPGVETSHRSDTSISLQATSVVQPPGETDLHRFSEFHGKGIILDERGRLATRSRDLSNNVVFSATPLAVDELFEIYIVNMWKHMAGTIAVGVTDVSPSICTNNLPNECYYLTGKLYCFQNCIINKITFSR